MKGLIRWVSPVLLAGSFLLSTNAALAANSPTRDVAQKESNRKLVVDFYDSFFNKHQVQEAAAVVAED